MAIKNLLVTGGAGFIGSNFVEMYADKYEITVLDKLTYAGRMENLENVRKKIEFMKGDICDRKVAEPLVKQADAVINFAAESHVDRSILDPESFVRTDVLGAFVLLEAAKKHGIEKFVQVSCYDEQTKVLTTDGLKNFEEIKEGDEVFSLNQETLEIEVKPVEKVIVQDYAGKMIHFQNKRIDIMVTPNHRMLILNTKKKLNVEEATKCSKRSVFFLPEGNWKGKDEEFFNLKDYGSVKTEDLFYLLGIFIGDGFTAYQENEIETKSGLNRKNFLQTARDKGSGRFKRTERIGSYKSVMHGYRIFFDIPEEDKCRDRVEKTLERLGISYNKQKGKAGTHLYFTSKPWMEFFDQCGKGAHNKHIPKWVLEYSTKYLKQLLHGLMDSDGHNNKIYHTVSEKLVYDICELCIKLNLKPSVHKRHTKSFFEGRKIEGDAYYVFVATTNKSISRHRIKTLDYKGKIWCLKVKDNKNFLMERNGRFDFCGNTDEVYGSIESGKSKESDELKPSSPYSASKAGADRLAYSYFYTFGLPVCITRGSNNYGKRQFPEKVIPLFATNLIQGKKVPLYGDGLNRRDWLFVEDHCKAVEIVLRKGKNGEAYNVSGRNNIPNIELTEMILREFGKGKEMIEYVEDRKGHDRMYAPDDEKITVLGFNPEKSFKEGLKETIQWYKSNEKWWKPLLKHQLEVKK